MSNDIRKSNSSDLDLEVRDVVAIPCSEADVLWFLISALKTAGREDLIRSLLGGIEISSCVEASENIELVMLAGEKECVALVGIIQGYFQFMLQKGFDPRMIMSYVANVISGLEVANIQRLFATTCEVLVSNSKESGFIIDLGTSMVLRMLEVLNQFGIEERAINKLELELYMENWMGYILGEQFKFKV